MFEFEKHNLNKIEKTLKDGGEKENFDEHLKEIKIQMQNLFKNECEMKDEIALYMGESYKSLN